MSDLQATFEFSIELYKFYNVDLFTRGLYQVRVGLRVSPKIPVHIEASVGSNGTPKSANKSVLNASIIGGLAASRAFQIMYRNEEISLRDVIHFRAHLLVDSRNLKESLQRAEWSLGVELWCSEGAQSVSLSPVSCRVLKLHFQPSHGLHYHLPVLFDYFHLAAVSITIHASLVALHQPYINTPRSSKQWSKLMKNASSSFSVSGSLENILFGSGVKCSGGNANKIAHARQVHSEVCGILLGSLEGLQNALAICGSTGALLTPEDLEGSSNSVIGEVAQRLKEFGHGKRSDTGEEEEWAMGAAHDIARLCAEMTIRWRAFLHHTTDRPHVHHALAARHHALRIKRFSECFFVLDNPRHSLAGCYDSNYQSYQSIGDAVRRSRYLALLPPLPVHCIALDGDPHIMPIIFEDRYQDTAEFARRRSVLNSGSSKSGSDPFLCPDQDCACSLSSVANSRRPSSEASTRLTLPKTIMDVLEPHINAAKSNIIQATLTLAPQMSPKRTVKQCLQELQESKNAPEVTNRTRYIVQNNQISEIPINNGFGITDFEARQISRFASSTILNMQNKQTVEGIRSKDNIHQRQIPNGVSTLPTRHSKSLDQLRSSHNVTNAPPPVPVRGERNMNNARVGSLQRVKPSTLPRSLTNNEYKRNIDSTREQNKNPYRMTSSVDKREINTDDLRNPMYQYNDGKANQRLHNNTNHYGYIFGNQGHTQTRTSNNPLDFQRGYHLNNLARPTLPPRNSYPPVNGKAQPLEQSLYSQKNVHRSSSSYIFDQNNDQIIDIEATRNQLKHELNYYLQKGDWSYDMNTGNFVQNYPKKSSKSSDDSGFVMTLDRSSDGTSKSNYSKTPPSTPHSNMASMRQKKNKMNGNTRDSLKNDSSRDSLSSHHSVRSKDSKCKSPKSSRGSPRSEKASPRSAPITPLSGLATPCKSGIQTPKSDIVTPKSGRSSGKSEKKNKYKASEKMSQIMAKTNSSSSNESIPFELRRMETSASVPYSLCRNIETLRHCRSAGCVLDELNMNNNFGSESLPNLAPPAGFKSPLLDNDDVFNIKPPDTFQNKYRSNSTSSLSEQSGWVSSGRSSGVSSPDIDSQINHDFQVPKPKQTKKYPTVNLPSKKVAKDKLEKGERINEFTKTVLNGDQLRDRLLKLAIKVAENKESEKIECCDKEVCEECAICSDSICTDSQCEYNKLVHDSDTGLGCISDCSASLCRKYSDDMTGKGNQRHNSFTAGQNKYPGTKLMNGASVKKSQTISDNLHPYIRKELPQKPAANKFQKTDLHDRIEYTEKLIAAELRSLTVDRSCKSHNKKPSAGPVANLQKSNNKAKSDLDLSHVTNEDNDLLNLPPPKQFRDIPPPPDQFKDQPSKSPKLSRQSSSKSTTPSRTPQRHQKVSMPLQLDNPLYHVCEGIKERRKQRPNQLVNATTPVMGGALSKSQSTGELASRKDSVNKGERDNSNLVSIFGLAESERLFVKCREEFRESVNYPGAIYSDYPNVGNSLPYFHINDEYRMFNPEGLHLIVCVHGLDGTAADLRLVKTYLELGLPGAKLDFLMSERNQRDTFSDFDTMTDRLVQELVHHIQNSAEPSRISFVGHSLGTIIIRSALARSQLKPYLGKLHTFLSLSGPHLGTLYNSSGLVNAGMWFMRKWKKSGSLLQLSLKDSPDPRSSFLYRLSERSQLHQFKHILLCGSGQDRYVPLHSARLELCKAAAKDSSLLGQAYREMVHNMVSPLAARASTVSVVRYDVQHALPHTASALVGRAAHIAALDSDLFIEKFLLVSALKYFR